MRELFGEQAVLIAEPGGVEARGADQIARLTPALCDRRDAYLAEPRRIVQARDTTLVVTAHAINVIRRGCDGKWRYAISIINVDDTNERGDR